MRRRILPDLVEEKHPEGIRAEGEHPQQGHGQLHRRGGGLHRVQLCHGVCRKRFPSTGSLNKIIFIG